MLIPAFFFLRLECQQLQEQVLQLKQQNEELRLSNFDGWFMDARGGLAERQRVIDAVYRSKCTWEDVGGAVLEVLNNDLIWDAVEACARQGKERVSRGLEALLVQLDALDPSNGDFADRAEGQQGRRDSSESAHADPNQGRSPYGCRRSLTDPARLIQCRACNGAGFIDPSDGEDGNSTESDSYLRKTLAQVLELRASLEQASEKSVQLELKLLSTVAEFAVVREKLQLMEFVRLHGIDFGVQVDLDDEEGIDLDEIMRSVDESPTGSVRDLHATATAKGSIKNRFTSSRNAQYEHLIVELKSSLDEKDVAISELRRAHKDFQERLLITQRTSQKEQEAHLQEVTTLKTSLTLALKKQNTAIEEKQATVTLMLEKFSKKKSMGQSLSSINSSVKDDEDEDKASENDFDDEEDEDGDLLELDALADDELKKLDEVKRSEVVARRYSQAVLRVQKEYERQNSLLQLTEDEIGQEDEKRKRTNSISLGNIMVSMASHPRDLFKALSTAQTELLNVRRATQRASTLQTDRLLTLTTHLGHLSEELCMVRKRTKAEIEFWKLECEKTQNTSNAVASDLQKTRLQLQAVNERRESLNVVVGKCTLCERHQARLMEISSELLLQDTQNNISESSNVVASDVDGDGRNTSATALAATQLTQQERQNVSNMVLEIENLYATISSAKHDNVRKLIAFALLGEDFVSSNSNSKLRVTGSPVGGARRSTRTELSLSNSNSARTFRQQENSDSARRRSRLYSGARLQDSSDNLCAPNEAGELGVVRKGSGSAAAPSLNRDGESSNQEVIRIRSGLTYKAQTDLENDFQRGELSEDLLISGTSMDDIHQPSHRKKKVVRKILSEDEVLRRKYVRTRISSAEGAALFTKEAAVSHEENEISFPLVPSAGKTGEKEPVEVVKFSSFLDPNGLEVNYEDVEVDDDDDSNEEDQDDRNGDGAENQVGDEIKEPNESADAVEGDQELQVSVPLAQVNSKAPAQQQHASKDFSLLSDRNDIESDPEVITQLRDLVKQHASVKESLALVNWKILLCHVRSLCDQNRLDWVS